MLKAESAGAGTPTATIGYKTAEMYVMDADGNNLKTINSYNNSSQIHHLRPEKSMTEATASLPKHVQFAVEAVWSPAVTAAEQAKDRPYLS